jgi:hypothetical protein
MYKDFSFGTICFPIGSTRNLLGEVLQLVKEALLFWCQESARKGKHEWRLRENKAVIHTSKDAPLP